MTWLEQEKCLVRSGRGHRPPDRDRSENSLTAGWISLYNCRNSRRVRGCAIDAGEAGILKHMRDAHKLARGCVIDPAYSRGRPQPAAEGLSLFSRHKGGLAWLYQPGDLDAFLLTRLRHEAFRACRYVGHPGRFRSFSAVLYARRSFALRTAPRSCKLSICFSGVIELCVNGRQVLHMQSPSLPSWHKVDLRPHLKKGDNAVQIRLHQIHEPPTFVLRSTILQTNAGWEVSPDGMVWQAPSALPFEGLRAFPHQERLPTMRLLPKSQSGEVYDFGVELLGRPEATVRPETASPIFGPGESVAEAMNTNPVSQEQSVVSVRQDSGRFASRDEMAMRFLRVRTLKKQDLRNVAFRASWYPTRYRGAFACSDEKLNRIWMHAAYTLRLCMREVFVDGIKRDRLGWVGDLSLSLLGNAYTFAERDIERRSLTALYGADPAACEFNGIVDYTLLWVISLWTHLLYHDDTAYLREKGAQLYALMRVLEAKEDAHGLLPSASFPWIFIDWAPVAKIGHSSCLQMMYAMALDAARRVAQLDGASAHAAHYGRKADRLRQQCRQWFWDGRRGLFVDNRADGKRGAAVSRHANFLAFLSGTVGKREYSRMLHRMAAAQHVIAVGTPYMMALESMALCRAGHAGRMLTMLRDYWGGMLDRGACAFWEAYDAKDSTAQALAFYGRPYGKSLCHAWSAGPAFLLPGELLGIRPRAPGWSRFTVEPNLGELEWACATVPTPHGDIQVEVEGSRVSVRAPKGTVWERPKKTR